MANLETAKQYAINAKAEAEAYGKTNAGQEFSGIKHEILGYVDPIGERFLGPLIDLVNNNLDNLVGMRQVVEVLHAATRQIFDIPFEEERDRENAENGLDALLSFATRQISFTTRIRETAKNVVRQKTNSIKQGFIDEMESSPSMIKRVLGRALNQRFGEKAAERQKELLETRAHLAESVVPEDKEEFGGGGRGRRRRRRRELGAGSELEGLEGFGGFGGGFGNLPIREGRGGGELTKQIAALIQIDQGILRQITLLVQSNATIAKEDIRQGDLLEVEAEQAEQVEQSQERASEIENKPGAGNSRLVARAKAGAANGLVKGGLGGMVGGVKDALTTGIAEGLTESIVGPLVGGILTQLPKVLKTLKTGAAGAAKFGAGVAVSEGLQYGIRAGTQTVNEKQGTGLGELDTISRGGIDVASGLAFRGQFLPAAAVAAGVGGYNLIKQAPNIASLASTPIQTMHAIQDLAGSLIAGPEYYKTKEAEATQEGLRGTVGDPRGKSPAKVTQATPTVASSKVDRTGPGAFDYNSYSDAIGKRESGAQGYKAINDYGYVGKYQFGLDALEDAGLIKPGTARQRGQSKRTVQDPSVWTLKGGLNEFFSSPAIQERAMRQYTEGNKNTLSRMGLIGPQSSPDQIAGLLASAHLVGPGNVGRAGAADAYGTTASNYYGIGARSQGATMVAQGPAPARAAATLTAANARTGGGGGGSAIVTAPVTNIYNTTQAANIQPIRPRNDNETLRGIQGVNAVGG